MRWEMYSASRVDLYSTRHCEKNSALPLANVLDEELGVALGEELGAAALGEALDVVLGGDTWWLNLAWSLANRRDAQRCTRQTA
jgi:hypothetical protein